MELELRRLEDLAESIVNDFAYMRAREEEMRDTNGKCMHIISVTYVYVYIVKSVSLIVAKCMSWFVKIPNAWNRTCRLDYFSLCPDLEVDTFLDHNIILEHCSTWLKDFSSLVSRQMF